MSADQADQSAKQFEQATSEHADHNRSQSVRLRDQYKPVGIPAVSAAAHFTKKSGKKSPQMS